MHVFTMAKQRMLEAILARIVVTLQEPLRSAIKVSSRNHAESLEVKSLYETVSDEEREIWKIAYDETLLAVFGKSQKESDSKKSPPL